ncbi:unnamed protein product, partial [Urochloa humidicola]
RVADEGPRGCLADALPHRPHLERRSRPHRRCPARSERSPPGSQVASDVGPRRTGALSSAREPDPNVARPLHAGPPSSAHEPDPNAQLGPAVLELVLQE